MTDSSGPAFPCIQSESRKIAGGKFRRVDVPYPGLSIRDYFAAAALTGLTSKTYADPRDVDFGIIAYRLADVMLTERSRNDGRTKAEEKAE